MIGHREFLSLSLMYRLGLKSYIVWAWEVLWWVSLADLPILYVLFLLKSQFLYELC